MNLEYGPEYEDFRAEVIDFCKEYEGISFENTSSKNISRSEWQKILIEKGFIARAIPKAVSYTHLTLPTINWV